MVRRKVPVADILPIFPADTHRRYGGAVTVVGTRGDTDESVADYLCLPDLALPILQGRRLPDLFLV